MIVGFIGLGTMGGSMALNVRAAGYDVVVHDLRPEAAERQLQAGCTWAASIEELGRGSDVVLTSLPGPKEVRAVALDAGGLLSSMKPGSAWFDLSTSSPTLIRELQPLFAAKQIDVLDAPVSGGPQGAITGALAIWAGGDQVAFERHEALLGSFSDHPTYIGEIGTGLVAKLVHNCAFYAIQAALAEVFTMGVKAGVEPLALWSAIRQGSAGRQLTFERLGDEFLQGKFDVPAFTLRLAHKDVSLATEVGREVSVPMRIANLVREEMTEAMNRGWAQRDSRSAMILQEERADVHIEVPAEQVAEVRRLGAMPSQRQKV